MPNGVGKISLIKSILFLIFPLSIIIDLFNGFTQIQMGIHTPIGQVYRFFVMACILYCIFLKTWNRYYNYLLILFSYFIFVIPIWILESASQGFNGFKLSIEIENIIKIIYFWIIIMFFVLYKHEISSYSPFLLIRNYGLLISGAIILSFITGYGNHNTEYGFGFKSYFKAGNDLGITILYSGVASSIYLVKKFTYTNLIKICIILSGGMLVGSRVAMVGCLFWIIILIFYLSFIYTSNKAKSKNNIKCKNKILIFKVIIGPLLIMSIVFFVIYILSFFDQYMLQKFSVEGIQNARTSLTDISILYIKSFDFSKLCWGGGMSCLYYYVGIRFKGNGAFEDMYRAVEADFHELIGGYGIMGFIIIISPFVYYAFTSLKLQIKKTSFINFSVLFITTSFLFIAFVGGHCIKNPMVAPVYGFGVSLLYNKK